MTQMMQYRSGSVAPPSYAVPLPSVRLHKLWGSEKIRKMIRYHHNLLRISQSGEILPCETEGFETVTRKTEELFVKMLSMGKFSDVPYFSEQVGIHRLYRDFDATKRETWLEMYKKAIRDMDMPSECIEDFWSWIESLSIRMLNRSTADEIRRFPYASVWTEFVEFTQRYRCGRP